MILAYKPSSPDRGEPEEYTFTPDQFPNLDAEACERESGLTWAEFVVQVQKGSVRCLRLLLWVLRRGSERYPRTLKPESVRFNAGEVVLTYDKAELEGILDQMLKAEPPATGDQRMQRDMAIAAVRDQLADPELAKLGKALARPDDETTSSLSSNSE